MSAHTSGPWRVGDAGTTVFGPKTDQPAPAVIATLPPPTARVSRHERKANAALIAAAPDLLAALGFIAGMTEADPEAKDASSLADDLNLARRVAGAAIRELRR